MKFKTSPKLNTQIFLSYFIVIGLMMILIAEPLNVSSFSSLGVWLIFIAVVSVAVIKKDSCKCYHSRNRAICDDRNSFYGNRWSDIL